MFDRPKVSTATPQAVAFFTADLKYKWLHTRVKIRAHSYGPPSAPSPTRPRVQLVGHHSFEYLPSG